MNHSRFLNAGLRYPARRTAQRGVSLLFALMALAAMLLAAVALVRSVDSGALVLGNLGFKQEATQAADRAAEVARAWLLTHGGRPDRRQPGQWLLRHLAGQPRPDRAHHHGGSTAGGRQLGRLRQLRLSEHLARELLFMLAHARDLRHRRRRLRHRRWPRAI